jgi:protein-L-isoaspartate O-methyltransferase
MSMQFYSILLHLNFSVLTVDRASPLSVKRSEGRPGWEEETPFQIIKAAISADDCDSGVAQLLRNGGKIEPYTIIIMAWGYDHPIRWCRLWKILDQ